ncbi:MAG: hypothetical protein V3W35_02300 [Gemmatimonadota bacterium]
MAGRSQGSTVRRLALTAAGAWLLLSSALPALAIQGDCLVPPELTLSRPDPEGVPTEMTVGAYLLDLHDINDAEQTFSADFFFVMAWRDERLLNVEGRSLAGCRLPMESIWAPRLVIVNERTTSKSFEDHIYVGLDGHLEYSQRFRGVFTNRLDLRDFPMDRQTLSIRVVLGRTRAEDVTFVQDERTGFAEEFSIADWTVTGSSVGYEPFRLPTVDQYFPQVTYRVEVRRNRAYYAQKVFLPLILIICMSWAVFWIDPKLVPPQIGISTSAVLTLIAFLFSLAYTLPRLSYLTRADRFVMGATVLVFFAFGEALLSTGLAGRGREALALRIDRRSRIVFPTVFAVILLYALVL